jgi:hypothetical protein
MFQFRRRFKLLPGVRLNVGKRGVSVSVGPRGAQFTQGAKRSHATFGLPGSGLHYTKSSRRAGYSRGDGGEDDHAAAPLLSAYAVDGPRLLRLVLWAIAAVSALAWWFK